MADLYWPYGRYCVSLSINPASHISYPSCKTSRKWMTQMYYVSHWMKTLGENNYVNSETSEIHANSYIMLKNPCIFPYYIWNPCKLPENLQSSCKLPNNVQNPWKRQIVCKPPKSLQTTCKLPYKVQNPWKRQIICKPPKSLQTPNL